MAYAEPKPVPEKDLDNLNADLEETDKVTRVEAALALRIAGASYSEIADVLGYASVASARLAVERSLASTITEESREEKRRLIARRIERLTRAVWGRPLTRIIPSTLRQSAPPSRWWTATPNSSAPTRPPKSPSTPRPSVRWSAGSPSRRRRCSPGSPRTS